GLARWKDGTLTQYPALADRFVGRIVEDRDGTVWASGLATPTGLLCSIHETTVTCYGEDGSFGYGAFGMYADRAGNLWLGVKSGLWRWQPQPAHFIAMPEDVNGIQGFADDPDEDGALLITTNSGVRRLVDEHIDAVPRLAGQFDTAALLRDRDGGLWIGRQSGGLVHAHRGRTDVYAEADGLSGDNVTALFEDREGSIWAVTANGLDRFREFAVSTFSERQGLPHGGVRSVAFS